MPISVMDPQKYSFVKIRCSIVSSSSLERTRSWNHLIQSITACLDLHVYNLRTPTTKERYSHVGDHQRGVVRSVTSQLPDNGYPSHIGKESSLLTKNCIMSIGRIPVVRSPQIHWTSAHDDNNVHQSPQANILPSLTRRYLKRNTPIRSDRYIHKQIQRTRRRRQ